MPLGQDQPVVPPVQTDKFLTDFSRLIQANLATLFGAAHVHVGRNGPITSEPKPTDGSPGDITIGVIGGSTYLFVKTDRSHWFKFGPATAL